MASGNIVETTLCHDSALTEPIIADGWHTVLQHQTIPFISYPYEWTFSMLKDAALLQMGMLQQAVEKQWTIKDSTPYNIQWQGAKPILIDTPSIEPMDEGETWLAYRQYCMLFLYPLMLKAHLDIDFQKNIGL